MPPIPPFRGTISTTIENTIKVVDFLLLCGCFQKIMVPQNGCFYFHGKPENPIKMDDLGITIIFGSTPMLVDPGVYISRSHPRRV